MLILSLALSARVAIDTTGQQRSDVSLEMLLDMLLEGAAGARRAASYIRQGKVDVDGHIGLAIQEGKSAIQTPLLLAAVQIYLAKHPLPDMLDAIKALLDAGANPNVFAGWESVLGSAITNLGTGADELWEMLIRYLPSAGVSQECQQYHDSASIDARSSCLPLLKLWASILDERMNWARLLSKADAVLHQQMFAQWAEHEARVFAMLKRSRTFADWFETVAHAAETGESTTDFRRLPATTLEKIAGEVFGYTLSQLSKLPGFSWGQAAGPEAWSTPTHLHLTLQRSGGLLHLLAYDGAVTALEALVNHVVELPAAAAMILGAMRSPDGLGRTPLHHLAFTHGMTEHFSAWMVQVERLSVAANIPWESGETFLAGLPRDSYQRLPLHYLERIPVAAAPTPTSVDRTSNWPRSTFGASLETNPAGRCDVDTVIKDANATQALFEEHLYSRWPVLIRNEGSTHRLRTKWNRDQFLDKYGSQDVMVGRIPYGDSFGQEMRTMSMAQYVEYVVDDVSAAPTSYGSAPPYLFQTPRVMPWLDADMKPSQTVLRRLSFQGKPPSIGSKQFYLGPPETGAPVHFHTDAVNYLMHGRKRWFLYPPGAAEWSLQPASEFMHSVALEQGAPIECVQHSGDMLYVPKGWGHSTINIEASIGVAYEFSHAAGLMEPGSWPFGFYSLQSNR